MHRRSATACAVEHGAQTRHGGVQRLGARERSEERRQGGGLHRHIDSRENSPRVALQDVAGGPRRGRRPQHVDELEHTVGVPLCFRLTQHSLAEQINRDCLAVVPQAAQTGQRSVHVGPDDELTGHPPHVAPGHRSRHDAAEWHLLGNVETQLHGARYGDTVEVLGHVSEHVVGIAASGEHVDEAEQLRLELGVRERPLEHLLAPPAEVERADPLPVARGRKTTGDNTDLTLE